MGDSTEFKPVDTDPKFEYLNTFIQRLRSQMQVSLGGINSIDYRVIEKMRIRILREEEIVKKEYGLHIKNELEGRPHKKDIAEIFTIEEVDSPDVRRKS